MKRMVSVWFVFVLLLISSILGFAQERAESVSKDAQFEKMIVGNWAEGESPYGVSSFKQGGAYTALVYDNIKKEKLLYTIEGKWWIKDGRLYNTANQITPPFPSIKLEDVIVDVIVDISESTLTLIDDEGKQYTNTRIKE